VFQKVHGPSVEEAVRELSAAGITTIYAVCDLVEVAMATLTDATITVTEHLRSLYPAELHSKIHVVHDGIENAEIRKMSRSDTRGSRNRRLHTVLVTSDALDRLPVIGTPPAWLDVTIVGRYPPAEQRLRRLREARWRMAELPSDERLRYVAFLCNRRIRRVAWDPVGVYKAMCDSDIGIIPIEPTTTEDDPRSGWWKVKSENRLTMKMSVGLPVIATPIPAYLPVIEHGRNGFFAESRQDWLNCLDALRDPAIRRCIGDSARQSVLPRYSKEEQARRLIAVLRDFVPLPA
jgi:glycosyltransferase involved in cell wall biosynthesis